MLLKERMKKVAKMYFGLAFSLSMIPTGDIFNLTVETVSTSWVKKVLAEQEFISCCNPSHAATLAAMKDRFGLEVEVPATPPRVELHIGDQMVVCQVSGLPRLTDRHEYMPEEIERAKFTFYHISLRDYWD